MTFAVVLARMVRRLRRRKALGFSLVMLTVLLSTFAHGISAYPFARAYGRHVMAEPERAEAEHRPALELPVRLRHSMHTETTGGTT